MSPQNTLQRKIQKRVNDYSNKCSDDLLLIVVNPSPILSAQENQTIESDFEASYHNQISEIKSRRIMTHFLRRWNEYNSSSHPSTNSMTPAEYLALNTLYMELK